MRYDFFLNLKINKYKLSSNHASPALMYSLPKHHKRDMPLRPISVNLSGPTRNVYDG